MNELSNSAPRLECFNTCRDTCTQQPARDALVLECLAVDLEHPLDDDPRVTAIRQRHAELLHVCLRHFEASQS